MKNKIQILGVIVTIFAMIYWLQSCDGTNFSSADSDPEVEEEPPEDVVSEEPKTTKEVKDDTPVKLTDEQMLEEFKNIQQDAKNLLKGNVKVCMAYVGTKGKEVHHCEKAKYKIFFNEETKFSSLNLNNEECKENIKLLSGKTLIKMGRKCSFSAAEKTQIDETFDTEFRKLRLKTNDHHVPGVTFDTKWKDGKVNVKASCDVDNIPGNTCHKGAVSISMIGEVKFSDGSKKYVKSELKTLATVNNESVQDYNLVEDFDSDLLDNKPEFDDYCGINIVEKKE